MKRRRVEYSAKFKKDLKRYKHDFPRRAKIAEAIDILASGKEIPAYMRPHKLIGNYAGYMELHIEGDLLLIWLGINEHGEELILLTRLGSHAELFKK